jgi:hypothetical protein
MPEIVLAYNMLNFKQNNSKVVALVFCDMYDLSFMIRMLFTSDRLISQQINLTI